MKKPLLAVCGLFALAANTTGAESMETRFKNGVLHFDYKAEQLAPAEAAARQELERGLAQVLAVPAADRTFENTVLAYRKAFDKYGDTFGMAFFLAEVSEDKKLRDAATELQAVVSQYMVELSTRRDLYLAIKEYVDKKEKLGVPETRLIKDMMIGFRNSGMELNDEDLQKFREINQKKSLAAINFNKNVRDHKDFLAVTREELQGLPEEYINRLEKTEDGNYKVTLDYPDYMPFMQNSPSDQARKKLEFKFGLRGGEENVKLLEEILDYRRQTAQLLGAKNYAFIKLENRMAKTPDNVFDFLKPLEKNLQPLAKKEIKARLKLKEERTGVKSKTLQPWEAAYWGNQYKKTYFDIDNEKIKEFFPSEFVLEQMMELFGNLFGINFERTDIPVWQKDVRAFKVTDKKDGALVAYVYMDLYPRDGKYKHGACFGIEDGYLKDDGSYQTPFTAVVTNFTPPSGGAPSLLKHDEVETLFHEFGHVLHNILTTAKYSEQSGTSTARDFVEAPSQLMENWIWEPSVLKKISRHYKTGLPLDDETIEKLIKSKQSGSASFYLGQNFYAQYDMYVHTRTKYVDTVKTYFSMYKGITGRSLTKGTIPPAGFGHIVGGYDAGYYGYLWSEVIAQDFYGVFQKEGIENPSVGRRFRDQILGVGGTYDEQEITEKFLGRKVSDKAFLKSLGLD